MASDSPDSHRKHRRSTSDEDSPGNTKRHKHRHHRHHRRHRHHRSKHSDAKKDETKEDSLEEVKETVIKQSLVHDYDDMEEGEIVEDEGEIAAKKVESDVESGEFMAADDRPTDFDDSYMQNVDADSEKCETENSRKLTKYLNSPGNDQSSEDKQDGSRNRHDELAVVERVANGDHASRSRKGESRSHRSGKPPLKESRKEKDLDRSDSKQQVLESLEIDDDDGERRNSSYSHKARDARHEARYRSPFHGRHHVEITSDRSRSESPDLMRERERSQSIVTERNLKMNLRHGRDERPYENGKAGNEMGEGRDGHRGSDYHRNGREKDNDRRRERSSSYHRASAHEGKHDGDSWDSETEEKMYRGKKMVEREASKERSERNWDKEREILRIKDREREKDSVRDRDRPRDTNSDMDWDKYRGGSRERDLERERRREKDRGGSRDRDMERERRREKDRGRSRDRDFESERRRDDSISMYRDRDTQRERDRSRKLEMERGRDRHSDRDRHIGKARDEESDRSRRCNKYDDRDDSYSNRDRHRGYDEVEDKKLKPDPAKDHSLKENGVNGDDDDQKDYQDTLEVNLTEREEDDVDRIKEESRRRREAILQKYKAQTLQQQQTVPQVLKAPDQKLPEQPSQKSTGVFQEVKNGANCDVKDASSSLGDTLTAVALGEGSPKSERSNDMFCDDIFGDSPAGVRKMGKGDGLHLERSGLHDNWDDPDGYYSFRFGEVLDNRYEITAAHGKGVFSTVVRAKDLKAGSGDPEEVAIKIIRNNETMLKAGTEELVILKKLVGADRDDRRHCVRYLSNFKYRNHLCIVFESLHMNLREVLKKFGRNIGLKLTAVRTYAKQLFVALKHLRNCGVLHCDIKPDNMLVNESKNVLKLCDFGNAMFSGKNEITPYLVSRFYRAPEIILGLPYDHPMDMWSIGCCLYELYTGKVLFPGPSNNDMLRLHMELKGPFPKKMLRKGAFIEQHFDQDLNFLALEEDPVTKKAIRRLIVNIKPKDFGNIIRGSPGEDSKMLANFKDLMDKIFVLDPDKRLTVSQALTHPFITGK